MLKASTLDAEVSRGSFLAAFIFALLASGSLVCERLTEGRFALGWLCSVAVIGGAMLVVASATSVTHAETIAGARRTAIVFRAHLCGVAVALALVHLAVFVLSSGGRLSERPAQVVNDVVLIVTTLGFVWSFLSRGPILRSILPLVSFGLLAAYAASMATWHVDPFPGLQVQHFVVQQVFSVSAGLLIFYFAGGT